MKKILYILALILEIASFVGAWTIHYFSVRKMGMILTINTKGTLLDEEWADFFGKQKPRRINITLYGADDKAYESLCHYPGGFEKTLRAIRLLKERGVDVKINGSVTRENLKDMDAVYRIGRNMDLRPWIWGILLTRRWSVFPEKPTGKI